MTEKKLLQKIRYMLIFFIVALLLSGITAFPVYSELKWATDQGIFNGTNSISVWLQRVWQGVNEANEKHPFLFYGFDWLAFAHVMIAVAFIGPYKDPIKNKWIIDWALLCCAAIIPLALICGPIRCIPWFHIVIDCSFGILGCIPLFIVKNWIKKLEIIKSK
jgi:hypothetical protein